MKKYKALSAILAASIIIQTMPAAQVAAAPQSASEDAAGTNDSAVSPAIDGSMKNTETDGAESAATETIEINTPEDFVQFADNCHLDSWSVNKLISLQQDIDLSNTSFETIPVFAGTFDGNGHTITGFRPTDQGYIVGLFRYIQPEGIVQDLTVQGNITATNEQECIGSICGINHGIIRNCSFRGIVSGQNTVGGIAGINQPSGVITGCNSNGRISGYYSTGGIAGVNHGMILFSNNRSGINDNSDWVEEDDEMGTGIFFSFQMSEDEIDLYSGVDTGGIAGYSDGQIELCTNYGVIGYEHTGYNIGGIAGRQAGLVSLCTNNGEIYGRKDVGGIVGQMEPDIEVDEAQSLRNAVNELHDLIEKTLDDMHESKNVLKSDLDTLSVYGDNALSSGDAMVSQMTDFVDDNIGQAQAVTDRMDYIMDMLPGIMDSISASGEAFSRMNDALKELPEDLDFMSAVDDRAYDETDYNRISLLSTVGGRILTNSLTPSEGDTVMITVAPNENYELASLTVYDADGDTVSCSGSGTQYSFTMPAANVRVEAYFQPDASTIALLSAPGVFVPYVAIDPDGPDTVSENDLPPDNGNDDPDDTGEPSPNSSPSANKEPQQENEPQPPFQTIPLPFSLGAPSPGGRSADKTIVLRSNLSGSASCAVADDTATLTIRPDTAYTLSGDPVVKDKSGSTLPVTRTQSGSYQYTFSTATATSPVTVDISFAKLNTESAIDNSAGNIRASIGDLQQNAVEVEECIQRINSLMGGKSWSDISDPGLQEQILSEIRTLYGCMGSMSASASSVLSGFSAISNILAPYVQDAAESALEDLEEATDEIHNVINSLKDAGRGVRAIVDYMNLQPDIQFSTLGPEFDANREELHTQLMGISDSLKTLSNNASGYSDLVNEDLKAVNDQLNVVFNLLADQFTNSSDPSVEELYEEVDIEDIDSVLTGRVDSSTNNGIVKGDINIGGVAGSMSIDEEDPEDSAAGSVDYQVGRRFITKCIISDSVNNGYITAKKDGAGGIVGYMRHGIVTDSEGYGNIESTEGDYVGGIAGESLTVIKDCYALCSVSGAKDVGGVAGYANTLQDCYAIVTTEATVGRVGAIAGEISEDTDGVVSGNYYVGDDAYGIDNISYANMAAPIAYKDLLATAEYLPTEFWHLKVTYRVEDTYLGTEEVKYGASLADLHYPEIPARDGFYGAWPDLSDQVMKGNLLIDGSYIDTVTVVESSEKAEGESTVWQKPYALVEQTFTEDTVLNAGLSNQEPPQAANGKEYVVYDISLENGGIGEKDTFAIRLLNPYGDKTKVFGYLEGDWTELEGKDRGQYIQVEMTGPKETFCIVNTKADTLLIIIAVVAGVAGLTALFLILRLSKRLNGKLAARFKRQTPDS